MATQTAMVRIFTASSVHTALKIASNPFHQPPLGYLTMITPHLAQLILLSREGQSGQACTEVSLAFIISVYTPVPFCYTLTDSGCPPPSLSRN